MFPTLQLAMKAQFTQYLTNSKLSMKQDNMIVIQNWTINIFVIYANIFSVLSDFLTEIV